MRNSKIKTKYKQVVKTMSKEEKARIEFMITCLEKNQLEPVKNYFLNLLKKDRSIQGTKGAANMFSKQLMLKQTYAERKMQAILDGLKINFKAQRIVYYGDGRNFFILDFYVPSEKLAIEVDGGYHETPEQKIKDEERSLILKAKGIKTIRFTNDEMNNSDEVKEKLSKHIKVYYLS